MAGISMSACVLEIKNLRTALLLDEGTAHVVDGVTLSVHRGETLALVGESGCGKTMTAFSILRLLPSPSAKIVSGNIMFENQNLVSVPEKKMREIRGNKISMIFQEPLTSLNPVLKIGEQIAETLRVHKQTTRREALAHAVALLEAVGIASPGQRVRDYPHQLSGGMRQRVMIAMALACGPELVIADEPTTALDVTVQAQIMDLLQSLKEKRNTALILITHDLGVVAETAQNVAVMYAGRIVEYAAVTTLFHNPLSPYTRGLLESLPGNVSQRLKPIKGMIPSVWELPGGCKFSTRCEQVFEKCLAEEPDLINHPTQSDSNHLVRCWLYEGK